MELLVLAPGRHTSPGSRKSNGECSRKLPARASSASNSSTVLLNSGSPAHASSRKASRSAGSRASAFSNTCSTNSDGLAIIPSPAKHSLEMAYTQNDAYLMTACRRVTSGQFPEQVGIIKLTEGPDTGGKRLVGNDSPDCWLRPPAYTNQHQV